MLVVMMLMTASSAMAQEAKFEVIDGFRYLLDTGAKTAMLLPQKDVKYSGDIIIPEKVKGNDGMLLPHWVMVALEVAVLYLLLPSLRLLLRWENVASMVAVVLKLFLLKVKCQRIHLNQKYQLQLLSKSQQNIYRIIKMLLGLVINISMPGILMDQVMIPSLLLHALHQPFLTNQES